MKNNILAVVLIIGVMFSIVGCAELISTEYKNVEVNIVDEYHRGMYSTPIRVGKVTTMQIHPAVYRITVEYNGVKYTINGRDTYNKYKEMLGQTTVGVLEIRTYDDGSILYDILKLE